ncbi:MAG: N,N-dimethylformamidase [Proteobacteria bacterium]|nr:N,N-dimethylformamidase [Pseudomonadota bacterium]
MMKLLSYTDRLWARAGQTVTVHASAEGFDSLEVDLVRLVCGDDSPAGPGYRLEPVAGPQQTVPAAFQAIHAGSCILADDAAGLRCLDDATVQILVWPTTPSDAEQAVMGIWDATTKAGFLLSIGPDGAALTTGDGDTVSRVATGAALTAREWYLIAASHDAVNGMLRIAQHPLNRDGRGERPLVALADKAVAPRAAEGTPLMVGAAWGGPGHADGLRPVMCFNGKVEAPRVLGHYETDLAGLNEAGSIPPAAPGIALAWDFSRAMTSLRVEDVSGNGRHGRTVNLPTRAMTGHDWTSQEHDWRHAPEQYGAIHLHDDDLGDAGWQESAQIVLPEGLRSGIYCIRLAGGGHEDMPPIVVQPPRGGPTAAIAFLSSTATYQTYANMHHSTDDAGAEMRSASATILSPSDVHLFEHRKLGHSPYDTHGDGSGVSVASARRPMLGYRPKAGLWSFNADTHVTAWLDDCGFAWDAISDHALHDEGLALLAPYKVVVTGTHPEYWSSAMWQAMTAYLDGGGRLMYLGGNGFYWRIAFHPEAPWALEIRRAQAGARYWIAEPGEYHMAFSGELGGLWQRIGIAPQQLVGIGTVATGFDSCGWYERLPDSFDPRAAWIFDGVGPDEKIGNFGQLGGAAGLELDWVDRTLGTPSHCLRLASSAGHSHQYLQTIDTMTFNHTAVAAPVNPAVRADMVFFETPRGGAVWSTGSIAWAASLAANGYDNNVARVTGNVLRRFADSAPIERGKPGP